MHVNKSTVRFAIAIVAIVAASATGMYKYSRWAGQEIDVMGLECRMDETADYDGSMSPLHPVTDDELFNLRNRYAYLILRAKQSDKTAYSQIAYFVPFEAVPKVLDVSERLYNESITRISTGDISWAFEKLQLRLTVTHAHQWTSAKVFSLLNVAPHSQWEELQTEVVPALLYLRDLDIYVNPAINYQQVHVDVLACHDVDPSAIRRSAIKRVSEHLRFKERLPTPKI